MRLAQEWPFTGNNKIANNVNIIKLTSIRVGRSIKIGYSLITCLALLLVSSTALTEPNGSSEQEYNVKAAFIYNFSKFIDWPESASEKSTDFNICIVGSNPFGENTLSAISTKTTKQKNVKFLNIESVEQLSYCYIAYIDDSKSAFGKDIIHASKHHNVLTISDQNNFTSNGGAIELFTSNRKVRFKINLAASKRAQLIISSRLLDLAIKVENREAQQ